MKLTNTLPAFELKGTDERMHSTHDYAQKTAIVVLFTCNHCPYARAYIKRIAELTEAYEPLNVGFFAINSNDAVRYPEDAFGNMIAMGKQLNLHGKYLHDESQEVARLFEAKRTPEVFLFDEQKTLVYQGAIDNNWEVAAAASQHYLKAALQAVLAGNRPDPTETPAIGCSIKWK